MSKEASDFDKLVERANLPLAIKIYCLAPPGFLSLGDWCEIYEKLPHGTEFQDTILSQMAKLKLSFEKWRDIANNPSHSSRLRELSLSKMVEKASRWAEWVEVYDLSPLDSSYQKTAVEKMAELWFSSLRDG